MGSNQGNDLLNNMEGVARFKVPNTPWEEQEVVMVLVHRHGREPSGSDGFQLLQLVRIRLLCKRMQHVGLEAEREIPIEAAPGKRTPRFRPH